MLGVLAIFTLPHQFHVGVVECQDERHLRIARWLFPRYMLLIVLPILPLARAGQAQLAALGVPSGLHVLALPLSQGQERWESRRVGKEWGSTCSSSWW